MNNVKRELIEEQEQAKLASDLANSRLVKIYSLQKKVDCLLEDNIRLKKENKKLKSRWKKLLSEGDEIISDKIIKRLTKKEAK